MNQIKKYLAILTAVATIAMIAGIQPTQAASATAGCATTQAVEGPFLVAPTAFNFTYVLGQNPPTYQSGTITNDTSVGVTYSTTIPNQPSWFDTSYSTATNTDQPNEPAGLGVGIDASGLSAGVYTTEIDIHTNYQSAAIIVPITLNVLPAGSQVPDNAIHPEGTNIQFPGSSTIYRVTNGYLDTYTGSGDFLSYGYNTWASVQQATCADQTLSTGPLDGKPYYIAPRNGALINDKGTIYLTDDNYRYGFSSAQAFLGLGYSFANVLPGDTSFLSVAGIINSSEQSHVPGTAINLNGTICEVDSSFEDGSAGKMKCFSSLAAMRSWGVQLSDVVPANSYDKSLTAIGSLDVYNVSNPMNP